jgi:hypothetical protein
VKSAGPLRLSHARRSVNRIVVTGTDGGRVRRREWDVWFWAGLACWVYGFVWHWLRPPSPILGLLVFGVALLYWSGFVAVVVAVVGGRHWLTAATLIPVLVVLTAVVNSGWQFAPRTWFQLHRPLFNRALETPSHEGNQLPWSLRFLAVEGQVLSQGDVRYFPQWPGMADDTGGYLYSPRQSPEDNQWVFCFAPVDLGDGWWMCRLGDSGGLWAPLSVGGL